MIDFDELRNEQLIMEREDYENMFFASEDILKSQEFDIQIFNYEYYNGDLENLDFDYSFADYDLKYEDCISKQEETLIKERESYEQDYFVVFDEMFKPDTLDMIIEHSFEYFEESLLDDYWDDFDFEYYDDWDCNIFDSYYFIDHNRLQADYSANGLQGYIVNEDIFDRLDGCDYPEGPDENLDGFKCSNPFDDLQFNSMDEFNYDYLYGIYVNDMEVEQYELNDYYDYLYEMYVNDKEEEDSNLYNSQECYVNEVKFDKFELDKLNNASLESYVKKIEIEEAYLNQLVEQHLLEEKEFFQEI